MVLAASAFSGGCRRMHCATYVTYGFTFRWWHATEVSISGISSRELANKFRAFDFKHVTKPSSTIWGRLTLILTVLVGLSSTCTFTKSPSGMGMLNFILASKWESKSVSPACQILFLGVAATTPFYPTRKHLSRFSRSFGGNTVPLSNQHLLQLPCFSDRGSSSSNGQRMARLPETL
ncbi:hypothetical protein A2U01_0046158, partial [Trifolium medium]|nr:hypothetical protein [Trifolium medium]